MVTPAPPTGGAESNAQESIRLAHGTLPSGMPTTKLIVTVFDTARPTPKPPLDGQKSLIIPAINFFFKDFAPTYNQTSACSPAPGISQAIYVTQFTPLLDPPSLRHSPHIAFFETTHNVEIIFDQFPISNPSIANPSSPFRPLKLALFDMDSTLINEEIIDELARSVGAANAVSAITARAMNGDIDFATSLKERVAMLKGVPITVWEDLKKSITIAEGARELIAGLKRRGVYTAVASGGFMPMAEWLKRKLGLDFAVANHLLEAAPTEEFPYKHLEGRLDPDFPIVTPLLKKDTLLSLAASRSFKMHETMAVGDGSNDLLMLGEAGLGIAWRAKEKVQRMAPMRLNGESLADLLFLLGTEEEQDV